MNARPRRLALLVALLTSLAVTRGARAQAPAPEPPFHVTADNLTGGRGPEGDVLFLNGNLRVVRGKTVLTADNGRYDRTSGVIDLTGRVKLVDSTTTATCDHATFSENDDRLNLDGNVVLVDKDATLRAPMGWYDRKAGRAFLGGGVTGTEKKQRLTAREATYLRDSTIVLARGDVRGYDEENKVELDAGAVDFHRRTRVAIATQNPVMRSTDDDGKVTTLRAMLLRVNSETKVAEAIDSVTVERDTLRARADRAIFDDRSGRGLMLGSPRAWDNETVVRGDTLETLSENHKLRRVIVRGGATMDYAGRRETNAGETSRLTGHRIDAFVVENRIDSLLAIGAAENAYKAVAKPGKTQEENTANGDTIVVWFKDRKVDRARVVGNAHGSYHGPVAVGDTVAALNEIVSYDGKRIEFVVPRNQIVLDGAAHLTYREMELNAKRVEFDSEKQTLVAQGQPQILDRGDKVDGHLMTYDLGTRTGTIYQAQTAYEKGLYRGERIRKASDNELDVLHGSYSTCDLDDPHYHFSARWMKIYLKDKLVAKPVVFYLKNIPVLALPFYVFPIKPGRHSGFLLPNFEFGFNNKAGQFIRNAGYYWAPNDYMDLTMAGDYYQSQPSWTIHADGNYKLLYAFDGNFNGQFKRDEAAKTTDYILDANHSQELSPRTRLIAAGNFTSSSAYLQNPVNNVSLDRQLNRFLKSNVSISHSAEWASISGVVDRIQDLDAEPTLVAQPGTSIGQFASLPSLTVSAPSLAISFPTRTLGSYSFFKGTRAETALASTYFSASAQYLSLTTNRAFVTGFERDSIGNFVRNFTQQQRSTRRGFESNASISDARRLFGWLTFSPGIFANAAVFDFDEQGHKVVPAATWSSQAGLSSTFYGTFKPKLPHVAGIRHIVAPSVGMSYSPDFKSLQFRDSSGVLRNRFNGFGGIGVSSFKSAFLSFALDQRFQVKLKDGDKITRLDNLLSWTTSGSYDFLWREHNPRRGHGLSTLGSAVVLQPPGVVSASLSAAVDPYNGRPLQNLGYNVGFNLASSGAKKQPAQLAVDQSGRKPDIVADDDFRDTWRLSLAYSYSGGYSFGPHWNAQKTANAVSSYQLSPNWQISWSAAYDVTKSQLLSQHYTVTRILHCWEATFTRSFTPGGVAEYYFRLGVRDQREIYYERGSRAQSFGGIQ